MLQYYDTDTKILTIPYTYNQELIDILKDTVKIIFQDDFNNNIFSGYNQEIKENVLPQSLTHLTFSDCFNQEIKENVLPNSLTHLTLGYNVASEFTLTPTFSIRYTLINYLSFNKEIKESVLPKSLTHLTFGDTFNQKIKINVLPQSLTSLTFGYNFNKIIKKKCISE
jgi:hypothetical protein